jgi:hypothetical protein
MFTVTPGNVRVVRATDWDPDTSYLDPEKDAARLDALRSGDWAFVGVYAEARLLVCRTCQEVRTPGLWGVESDSDRDHFEQLAREELAFLGASWPRWACRRTKSTPPSPGTASSPTADSTARKEEDPAVAETFVTEDGFTLKRQRDGGWGDGDLTFAADRADGWPLDCLGERLAGRRLPPWTCPLCGSEAFENQHTDHSAAAYSCEGCEITFN